MYRFCVERCLIVPPHFFAKGGLIIATTTLIPLHAGKGRTVAAALGASTDYVKNPDKTQDGQLISSYECDSLTVDAEFNFSKNQYAAMTGRDYGKRDVLAYYLRQSFKPGEVDAETVNKIGYDLAFKLTKGNHVFICCTHVDKQHIHSHIIFNSTSLDCTRKFRNFFRSSFAIRRISDLLCIEHGLSIIEQPQPSKGKTYGKWLGESKPPTTKREKLMQIIDVALDGCADYTSFIRRMQEAGCEVKQGKHLAFKAPGQEKFIRVKSLGDDYTEQAIRERIAGKRYVTPKQKVVAPAQKFVVDAVAAAPVERVQKPNFLIDIEAKLQQARSPGFEHFARLYNLKESARTLFFLQERGIKSYDALVAKDNEVESRYSAKMNRIREIESRLKGITELQRQIGNYSKHRETYVEYLRLKKTELTSFQKLRKVTHPADEFHENNYSGIALYKASKKYFDEQGYDKNKKLPTIAMLKKEYAILEKEKRQLYSGCKEHRQEMVALKMAKQNVDRILAPIEPPKVKSRAHELSL